MSLEQLLAWIPPGSPDEALARQVNFEQLPAHIAIIMDGNGRWAAQRHLPRVEGHRAGIDSVRDVVETSARLGIEVLTLYAFSLENWKRPRAEINTLMTLLRPLPTRGCSSTSRSITAGVRKLSMRRGGRSPQAWLPISSTSGGSASFSTRRVSPIPIC